MELEPSPRMSVKLPEKFGRHEIVAHLGQGGMAQVYLAVQRGPFGSTKLVVIKKLKADGDANGDANGDNESQFMDMFVDEARIAMRLSHPNIVNTFDFVTNPDEVYLIMEYLDGQSLLQVLRKVGRENVPLDLHVWILTQVLAGLGYAHSLRDFDGTPLEIVHRDVTPSNVIVTYAGEVKLVDFGIAKVAGAVAITQSGMMKGKLGYISPEQCLGRPTTARSDLYSIGVMLWEAMAKKRRTLGETPAAIFQARIQGKEQAIEEAWVDAPPALVRIARRALASDPMNRYPTAREFQQELEAYLMAGNRPVMGPRVLTDFMARHFAEDMQALHRTIESGTAKSFGWKSDTGDHRPITGEGPMLSSELHRRPDGTATGTEPGPVAPVAAPAREGKKGRPRREFVALGVATFVLLTVVSVLALRGGGRVAQPEVATAAPTATTATEAATGLGQTAPLVPAKVVAPPTPPVAAPAERPSGIAGAVELVKVHLSARPRNVRAVLMLDGEPLPGNPYVAHVPKATDRQPHMLSASADGYETVERPVVFDRDTVLNLKLLRRRGAPGAPVARAISGSRPAAPVSDKLARPDAEAAAPGSDLHHSSPAAKGPARPIDEKDPYTQ